MPPSTDRRRGGGPVATASRMWRPRYAAPAPGPDGAAPAPGTDGAAPILPLPTPAPEARPRRPNHGNSGDNRRPDPPQEQNGDAGHHRHGPPPPAPAPARETRGDGAVPQLVQEIQDKLARGAVECMICYDVVRRSAPVWSCGSCFSIFHLPCIRKWVRSPASAGDASQAADHASPCWRCPGCQFVYATPAHDLAYTCFCGRRRDPPNDHLLTPHSCGEPCSRPLEKAEPPGAKGEDADATRCPHVCVLQCHPGPCPPCKAFAPDRPCPCGKQIIVRLCADRSTPVTCGIPCEQMLPCKRHRCEKVCHTGSCGDCAVVISARCFCAKKNEKVLCREWVVKGKLSEEHGLFSCSEMCGRILATWGLVGSASSCRGRSVHAVVARQGCRRREKAAWTQSPTATRFAIRNYRVVCIGARSVAMMENARLAWCALSRSAVVAHQFKKCRCCYTVSMEEFRCNKPCGRKKNELWEASVQ